MIAVSSVDAFGSRSMPRRRSSSVGVQPLMASELKAAESAQFNETFQQQQEDAVSLLEEGSNAAAAVSSTTLSDDDMVNNMSEQMSDLLTELDDEDDDDDHVQFMNDDVIFPEADADELQEEEQVELFINEETYIVEEMRQNQNDNDDYEEEEEEDPALKELEETLLTTIQVLEDTLQETQIVNELETRELKEEQSRLEQELQEQKELNNQAMKQLHVERHLSAQLAAAAEKAQQQQQQVPSIVGVESLMDPSTLPEDGFKVVPNDLIKLLEMQQEKHAQEMKTLEQKLKQEEDKRLGTEKDNARLEAAASAAKAIAEDTKQEDTVLQQKLQEQQELLELASRKLQELDAKLSTSQQALKDQTNNFKAEQAAVKANKQELEQKISKLEAEFKTLTMKDNKAQATISNLEATQTELEETLKKFKHEKATSKAAAATAQKGLKQTKQSLAESMAKIGRLETKLARAQKMMQSSLSSSSQSTSSSSSRKETKSPPPPTTTKKETTIAQANKKQPPKTSQPASSTALKVPRLDNWELTKGGEVQGSVYDHPSLPDGEPIRTSVLVNPKLARDGGMVKTSSGSSYKLGKQKKRKATSASSTPSSSTTPKQPVQKKAEPKAKVQVPSSSSPPAAKKQTEPKKSSPSSTNLFNKKTEPKRSPSMNLFSSFDSTKSSSKERKKKKKETEDDDSKPTVAEESSSSSIPKAKKAYAGIGSIFAAANNNNKAKEQPEEDDAVVAAKDESTVEKVVSPPPAFSNIFGMTNTKATKETEAAAVETKEPSDDAASSSSKPPPAIPLPRINFFGNTAATENKPEQEETKEADDEPEDESNKRKPYSSFNIFGSKPAAATKDKSTSESQEKPKPEPATPPQSTSAYGRKQKVQTTTNEKKAKMEESSSSNEDLPLTGRTICNGKYLLAGKPKKSVTGRCLILGAYHADADSKPTGNPIVIKLSENTDAMRKEHSIYKRVASAVNKGVVVKCHSFIPEVEDRPGKSALILERGARDLKEHRRWIGMKGDDLKDALFSVAQCLESIHAARMVWTDLKTENFVVVENEDGSGGHKVKAIDLESAMNVNNNPKDFTPEASPPEFAREYVNGDPHSFVLNYSFDIWSFGMLAYELAAGSGYYDGTAPNGIMQKLSQKIVPNPSIGIKDDELADLISQCLELDPKQRPSAQKIIQHPYFSSIAKPSPFQFNW